MRDRRCSADIREAILFYEEEVNSDKNYILELEEDQKQGIQKYPRDNISIIKDTYADDFQHEMYIMKAKYSLGDDIDSFIPNFNQAVSFAENASDWVLDYYYILWLVSLEVLLEVTDGMTKRISGIVLKSGIKDYIVDFLQSSCDKNWKCECKEFYKKKPYQGIGDIIKAAQSDKLYAAQLLEKYIKTEWLKGHYDCGWKNAHKEKGFNGLWSFEAAAVAKILNLDDAALKMDVNYPYDLAHYKCEKRYEIVFPLTYEIRKAEVFDLKKFITAILADFKELPTESFYNKYEVLLKMQWETLQIYNKDTDVSAKLGKVILSYLITCGKILQADWKIDWEDGILLDFINNRLENDYAEEPIEDVTIDKKGEMESADDFAYIKLLNIELQRKGYGFVFFLLDDDQYYIGVVSNTEIGSSCLFEIKLKYV